VRLRRRGAEALLTVKHGHGRTRAEIEIELSSEQLERLWPLTEGRRVRKRRYLVPEPAGTFELDVYEGRHAGLRTAEIELEDEAAVERVELPGWLGPELTGEPGYENRSLAEHGLPP
jgi:adenylate cyclase